MPEPTGIQAFDTPIRLFTLPTCAMQPAANIDGSMEAGDRAMFEVFIPRAAHNCSSTTVIRQLPGWRIQTLMYFRSKLVCSYTRHCPQNALGYARRMMELGEELEKGAAAVKTLSAPACQP
jgi:hypothetical protein